MKGFIFTLFSLFFVLSVDAQQFMKVSADPVIAGDNQRCFQVKLGYSRKDTTKWEPYCGKFVNFYYEQGYEYTLQVDNYDPKAEVMKVIKVIGRDNSASYRKQRELRQKKETL